MTESLVETIDLEKHFPLIPSLSDTLARREKRVIHAVDGVSLQVRHGETLGLIGESGSGKTTLGMVIARLQEPTRGRILFSGKDITALAGRELLAWRRQVQVVFQDPIGSLDPRMRVWQIVGEPLLAQGKLEPTSALDVAVQAQILNRLVDLQSRFGFSYLMISHNVAAVRFVADRVAVMYLGKIAEAGPVRGVLERPLHPYTKALLAALPVPDSRRRAMRYRVSGEVPTLINPPPGCRFAGRCPFVIDRCREEEPLLRVLPGIPDQWVACHRAEEVGEIPPEELLGEMPTLARSPRFESRNSRPSDSTGAG